MKDLLDRSLLMHDNLVPYLQFVNIKEVTKDTIEMLQNQADLKRIKIKLVCKIPPNIELRLDSQRYC